MNKLLQIILITIVLLALIMPSVIFASSHDLIPCGKTVNGEVDQCGVCDFLVLANNVVNFLTFKLAMPLAVLALLWGGFLMMTAGSNPDNIKKGKNYLFYAIIGIVVVFAAWIIVHAILVGLVKPSGGSAGDIQYGSSYIPWSKFPSC